MGVVLAYGMSVNSAACAGLCDCKPDLELPSGESCLRLCVFSVRTDYCRIPLVDVWKCLGLRLHAHR